MTNKCFGQFNGQPCVTEHAPHRRGMCALAGIEELRRAVQWANGQPESQHETVTAEEILARYRRIRDEGYAH